jgi:hypothetical protein
VEIKIHELQTNSKNRNIRDLYRGICDFKNGYHLQTNIVKDEEGDLLADPHNILNKWNKNHSCQLFNVYGVNDVRQTVMQLYINH